jgi:hypothetical protein
MQFFNWPALGNEYYSRYICGKSRRTASNTETAWEWYNSAETVTGLLRKNNSIHVQLLYRRKIKYNITHSSVLNRKLWMWFGEYFTMLPVSQNIWGRIVGWLVNNKLEGSRHSLIEAVSRHSPGGTVETTKLSQDSRYFGRDSNQAPP